jgi:predicted DNA-binding transcriptional regulator YafY
LSASDESVDGALAKLHRVLPDTLRSRVQALESSLDFTAQPTTGVPVSGNAVLLLAEAIRRRRRLRMTYRSFSGDETRRELSPHGLVVHSGRWYLAAHDHLRHALRTFRVDRMRRMRVVTEPAIAPPDGFDAVVHVSTSLARVPWPWEVEVLLDLAVDEAARRVPATLAELVDEEGRTLLRMRVGSLDWMATVLAGLGCSFAVRKPDELRARVRVLGKRLASV